MATRIKGNQIDYPMAALGTPVIVGIDPTDNQPIYRIIVDLTAQVTGKVGSGSFGATTVGLLLGTKSRVLRLDLEWEGAFGIGVHVAGVNEIVGCTVSNSARGSDGSVNMIANFPDAGNEWLDFTKLWLVVDYKD